MIVDAHHHLWDPGSISYTWQSPDVPTLYRPFVASDIDALARDHGVVATVIVQAADSIEETRFMLDQAQASAVIKGVVAWAPLMEPKETENTLDRYEATPEIKGFRHLINYEPDADWLLRPTVIESLGLLADRGYSFDVTANKPRHLEAVVELADRLPHLRMVIDHLGKPNIKARELHPWANLLAACASAPTVYAKISGLNTAASDEWTSDDLRPYVEHALDVFGASRCMFGSDWPVALIAGDYTQVLSATEDLLADLVDADRDLVLAGTAVGFYGLARETAV
jgi:L-fuconolactonase